MIGEAGDRVAYVGNVRDCEGMTGEVIGPGEAPGRTRVHWSYIDFVVDMSDTVLAKATATKPEEPKMPKPRKTTVTHPDGTQSTRSSAKNVYTHAVEQREDMWAYARVQHAEARRMRERKARFIEAVRGGKIAREQSGRNPRWTSFIVSVVHPDGEKFYLGADYEGEPAEAGSVDRKDSVRRKLTDFDSRIAAHERDALKAESGPQYRYGVVRWSMSAENAAKGLREFETRAGGAQTHTYRVVPAG